VFTCELAGRAADHGVSVYVMHPGVVKSAFGSDGWGAAGTLWNLFVPKLTPQQGADTLVHLITTQQIEEPSGTYFFRRQAKRSSPVSHDLKAQQGLWELSERLTAIVGVPGVSGDPGQ
jgi:hypothetical protein